MKDLMGDYVQPAKRMESSARAKMKKRKKKPKGDIMAKYLGGR